MKKIIKKGIWFSNITKYSGLACRATSDIGLKHYLSDPESKRSLKKKSPLSSCNYKLWQIIENWSSNYNLHLGDKESTYQD